MGTQVAIIVPRRLDAILTSYSTTNAPVAHSAVGILNLGMHTGKWSPGSAVESNQIKTRVRAMEDHVLDPQIWDLSGT